ncbi:unnamed protein product [Amoebophrya sp. A25]|nr:unnamed protein product [Amoebophrya sp. A25]|eukprot:GSA25T00023826001.1
MSQLILGTLFVAHATCSVSMVLFNKTLAMGFDYPWTVVFIQNIGTIFLGFLWPLCFGKEELKVSADAAGGERRKICGLVVPSAWKNKMWVVAQTMFFVGTLYFSLKALRFMSVPLYVVARNTVPAATALVERAFTGTPINFVPGIGLLCTVIGAVLYTAGDMAPATTGGSNRAPAPVIESSGLAYAVLLVVIVAACSVVDKTAIFYLKKEEGISPVESNQNRCFLSLPVNILLILTLELYKENVVKAGRRLLSAMLGLEDDFCEGDEVESQHLLATTPPTLASTSSSGEILASTSSSSSSWRQQNSGLTSAISSQPIPSTSSILVSPSSSSALLASTHLFADATPEASSSNRFLTSSSDELHQSLPPLLESFINDMHGPMLVALLLSTFFGFGIGTFNFMLQQKVTAATVQVANIFYKLMTTILSRATHPTPVSTASWCGFAVSLAGVGLYTFGNQITTWCYGESNTTGGVDSPANAKSGGADSQTSPTSGAKSFQAGAGTSSKTAGGTIEMGIKGASSSSTSDLKPLTEVNIEDDFDSSDEISSSSRRDLEAQIGKSKYLE